MTRLTIAQIVLILVVFHGLLLAAAGMVWVERRLAAVLQQRIGPNRVGWAGLLQPFADVIKLMFKEELRPKAADAFLFGLAPIISAMCAFAAFAVVPFGGTTTLLGLIPEGFPLQVADVNVAILVVFAIASMSVYGIVLAGWSSNSKYALLGGLRASAQMISYEVPMGLSLIPVLLLTGNVSLSAIVHDQQLGLWFVLPLFLSFFIFLISGFAETNRLPFDLPEAESELIAGYHTEYSAMKFSFFFIAEYANVVTVCAMVTTLFFGGWDIPGHWDEQGGVLQTLATGGFFFLKLMFWIFFVMWIRWTLPRFRYDQLMALGWKVLTPLALAYIMVVCVAIYLIEHVAGLTDPTLRSLALFGVNVVLGLLVFGLLDSGVFIRGADRRAAASEVAG